MEQYLGSVKKTVNRAKLKKAVAVAKVVAPKKGIFSWFKNRRTTIDEKKLVNLNISLAKEEDLQSNHDLVLNTINSTEQTPRKKGKFLMQNLYAKEPEPEIISDFSPLRPSVKKSPPSTKTNREMKDEVEEIEEPKEKQEDEWSDHLSQFEEGNLEKNKVKGVETHAYDFINLNQSPKEPKYEPISSKFLFQEMARIKFKLEKDSFASAGLQQEKIETIKEDLLPSRELSWKKEKALMPVRGNRKNTINLGGALANSKRKTQIVNLSGASREEQDEDPKDELNNSIDYPLDLVVEMLSDDPNHLNVDQTPFFELQGMLLPTVLKFNYNVKLIKNLAEKTETAVQGIIQFRKNLLRSHLAYKLGSFS